MYSLSDLPDTIPLFTLPGALVLPRGRLPLHVFEPRYLTMVDDCLKTQQRLIGMIQPKLHDGLHDVGCVGRLVGFSETEDRRYMVTLAGVARFRLKSVDQGFHPYDCGTVDWSDFSRDLGAAEKDKDFERKPFITQLKRFFDIHELDTDWDSLEEAEDELLINSLSMMCPFDPEEKQALLESSSLRARRETLSTLIEFALRGGQSEDKLQ